MRLYIAIGLLLATVTTAMAAAEPDISGHWYGEGYQREQYLQWLAFHAPDGSLSVEFREYRGCELVDHRTYVGRWQVSGHNFDTDITTINGRSAHLHFHYVLEKVTPNAIEYSYPHGGLLFKASRVTTDFHWPDCDPAKLVS